MICVIRRLALTVSDVCLKLGCFQSRPTSTYCALEVSHFMRYINSRLTYLLTLRATPCRADPSCRSFVTLISLQKTRTLGLPAGWRKECRRYVLSRSDTIRDGDRQTDRQTLQQHNTAHYVLIARVKTRNNYYHY